MEIKITYTDDGDVMVKTPAGEVKYYFIEYSHDIANTGIFELLEKELPKYKETE